MKLRASAEQLMEIVRAEYNKLSDSKQLTISSGDVANRAYQVIDPHEEAPPLAQTAAYLELEELATKLREKHRTFKIDPDQPALFEGLQKRYCVMRRREYVDVLREDLTLAERKQISSRLHALKQTYDAHAKAFDAETQQLLKSGFFHEEKKA